ncbi:MAG: EAL domain-containing protein [Gammaproteobacteria bacterium]|nr:EAL domain-containing protein [Gammaproteobacteria bacterium]
MKEPPLPPDESTRLSTLHALSILDTPPEARFDRITRFAARLFDVPIALISLVDAERQWFKSCQGLDVSETPRGISFCGHAILGAHALVVPDARLDERFADNPLVTGAPHIRFYAGFPISAPNGSRLGTFCIIDYRPRHLDQEQLDTLHELAVWAQHELHGAELARAFQLSQQNASLRKQFHELNAIYELTHATSQAETLDDVYQQALRAIKTTLHTWRAAILLFDEQGVMRFTAWEGLSGRYRSAADGHSPWSAQETNAQPILVNDVRTEPSLAHMREAFAHEGIRALGFIPLVYQKRLLGKLMLHYDQPREFSTEEIQLAQTIASHVAFAIERKAQTERLKYQALHDSLTALPNRILLREHLQRAIPAASQGPRTLSLLLIDLDGFKEINDTLGHDRGDVILQQVAARIRDSQADSAIVARLGGDEFAVLLTAVSEGAYAMRQAHKIIAALRAPFTMDGLMLDIGASIGIVDCPEHGECADLLIRRADVAMYVAKQRGGGCSVYTPEHDQHSPSRLALLGELRHSIEHDQVLLYYQPVMCLTTRRVLGAEALVRWQHPSRGLLLPDQFIPQAEPNALISSLTLWVLNTALRQCSAWRKAGLPLSVSVNLSARNLHNMQLPNQVMQLLEETGAEPDSLELEITESAIMSDPVHAKEILARLSHMGVRLSIDDFGTGYSSLSYLKKLPVDEIKVDKSFVIDMVTDEDSAAIVRSTIELAHNLNLQVVAEGVETLEILDRLVALGCDKAQGYFFSRPLPADEFQSWLLNRPRTP